MSSNIDRTKSLKNNIISNYDIQRIYLNNESSQNDIWLRDLFNKLSFLAISRTKNYKNKSDKEDLLQSLYLALWKALKTFDPHKNFDFYRWSSWHINRCIRDFQNSNRRFASINLLGDGRLEMINIEDKVILLRDILKYSSAFSKRDKQITYSYYVEGYTLSEIGKKEGLSAEGVRKVHNKIIKILRKKMN